MRDEGVQLRQGVDDDVDEGQVDGGDPRLHRRVAAPVVGVVRRQHVAQSVHRTPVQRRVAAMAEEQRLEVLILLIYIFSEF